MVPHLGRCGAARSRQRHCHCPTPGYPPQLSPVCSCSCCCWYSRSLACSSWPGRCPSRSLVATTLGEFRVSITEVLVLLYVAAALLSMRRTRGLPRPLLLLPGLVLFAVLMLSILRSQDIESSLEEIIKWAELLAVYVVTVVLLRVTRWRWWVVGGLLVAAMAEAGVGLVQTLGRIGPEHFLVNGVLMRAHGTFGQPNPFAGYLVLFFPIALALWAFGDLEARLPWIRLVYRPGGDRAR